MGLVGDAHRDRVAALLRRAYAGGTLTIEDHDRRVEAALRARTEGDLAACTRGIPGAWMELVLATRVAPAVEAGRAALRPWLARLVLRATAVAWTLATAVLLLVFAVAALASEPTSAIALGALVAWLAVTGGAGLVRRRARQALRRPIA